MYRRHGLASPTSAPSRRSWTSSAVAPTGASATSRPPPRCARATPTGIASRRSARAWTPTAASPTTGPIACSGPSMAAIRCERSGTGHGRSRPHRSRSSISMRCGPTPATSNAAPPTKPIRLASKSVRCRALQSACSPATGSPARSRSRSREALWLARHGVEDVVVAYPTADRAALGELARLAAELPRARVTVMVDDVAQLDLIDAASPARRSGRGADARVHRPRRRLSHPRRAHASSAPSARPSTPPRRPPRSPARSSPATAPARRDHVLRGADRRPR